MSAITPQTQQKINRLFSHHFRLHKNNVNFNTLEKLFVGDKSGNLTSFDFLQKRKLVDANNKLTPLGFAIIISHKLDISLLSIFLISRIYAYQITTPSNAIFPKQTLIKDFENFSKKSILNRLCEMKQKNILISLGYKQLQISEHTMKKLSDFKSQILSIQAYLFEIDEESEKLIFDDPTVQNNIKNNLKSLSSMKLKNNV